MEWLQQAPITAIAAWTGAATGVLGTAMAAAALWINWQNRRDTVRERETKSKASEPWARLVQMPAHLEMPMLRALIHNPSEGELTVTKIEVLRPKGAKVGIVYSADRGPVDIEPPAAAVPVSWRVFMPSSRGVGEPSGTGNFRLKLPSGGSPRASRAASSDKPQIEVEIALIAEPASPNRKPTRMTAKAVIEL